MSLREELERRVAARRATQSAERIAAYEANVEAVIAAGIAERALGVGDRAPDFALPDASGTLVSSDELLARGPIVVSFYRGGWCGYCSVELRALVAALPDIRAAGAELVALSPQTVAATRETVEEQELPFPVLADLGNVTAHGFGIVHAVSPEVEALYAANEHHVAAANEQQPGQVELPMPATYVIDRDGIIRFAFVSARYTERAEPADVLAVLADLRA
jgi:peroxiredoxin